MNSERVVNYIENSFLRELILDENVTDISYNGYSIYYLDNLKGRRASKIKISNTDAKDFLRQVANLTEKQFSFQNPILDVSAGRYRLNAVHNSIGRNGEEEAVTFSIRLASIKPRITDDSDFLTDRLKLLFKTLIDYQIPIIIGGVTGTGKTEFQKYLISKMDNGVRVIVIDNVLELSRKNEDAGIDLNVWQADEKNVSISIQTLVKNSLRSNPDWLIVAESRGGEMLEILNSALTGHPIITTIHATDVESMPTRIARMVMMNDKKSEYKEVLQDVYSNFPVYVHLKRKIDKHRHVQRFISAIAVIDNEGHLYKIYELKNQKHLYRYYPIFDSGPFTDIDDEVFIKILGGAEK